VRKGVDDLTDQRALSPPPHSHARPSSRCQRWSQPWTFLERFLPRTVRLWIE